MNYCYSSDKTVNSLHGLHENVDTVQIGQVSLGQRKHSARCEATHTTVKVSELLRIVANYCRLLQRKEMFSLLPADEVV